MWIDTAAAIVRIFGPCQIVQWRAHDPALLKELLLGGCDAYAVGPKQITHPRWISDQSDTAVPRMPVAVLEVGADLDTLRLLDGLRARDDLHGLFLITHGFNGLRKSLDQILFKQGWRRHPGSLSFWDYEGLRDDELPHFSAYQRIPAEAAIRWPIESLLKDRNLHMDMLRESGARADAHIARYALAASLVRPGDTVLDCACGLGYGSAVIATMSQASKIIGVDVDAETVSYANANYGGPGVSFELGDAAALNHIPDASVDLIVSMETIEHVMDWKAVTKQFARILKPDGRLIASVPDRWMDETGEDPSPYHHHVFDWGRLRDGLIEDFVIEARYIQEAPGGFKWTGAARKLQRIPLHHDIEAEWILVVASANPFARAEELRQNFFHPSFGQAFTASGSPMLDYVQFMDNPWLYRTLIQLGERVADDNGTLRRLANWVAGNARPGSADQGAALCVAGYRILEQRQQDDAPQLLEAIKLYHEATDGMEAASNPHVQRWRISSAFLAGRLCELWGDAEEALDWFSLAAHLDWRPYSAALTTKTIAAAFHAARLSLARNNETTALSFFQLGFNTAIEAAHSNPRDFAGSIEAPNPFGLIELGEVMDMGGQCAVAIATLPLWRRSPGAFWSRVDAKRFGVFTWTQAIEAENSRLRAQFHARN